MMRFLSVALSLLLALSLLMSGCAEGVSLDVRDITVKCGDESILLNPAGKLTFSEDGDTVGADMELYTQDGSLMCLQAVLDDEGVKLTTDKAEYVYSISKEALDMEETGMGEVSAAVRAYIEMLKKSTDAAFMQKLGDEMKARLFGDGEECTYSFNGEELPARKYTGEVDFRTLWAIETELFTEAVPDFAAYSQLMETVIAEAGETLDQIKYTYEYYETEDGQKAHVEMTVSVNAEEESVSLPIIADVDGAQASVTCNMTVEGVSLDLTETVNMESGVMDCTVSFAQDDAFSMHIYYTYDGAGSGSFNMDANDYTTETAVGMTNTFAPNANGGSDCATALTLDESGESYELSFNTVVTTEELPERFTDKPVREVKDDDGMNEVGAELMGEFMQLYSALMQDPSVQQFATLFVVDTDGDEGVTEGEEPFTDGEGDEKTSENVEDLSLGVPQFAYIPEGYALDDTFCMIDEYSEYATFSFSNTDYDMVSVNFSSLYNGDVTEYIMQDGTVAPLEGALVCAISHNDEYDCTTVIATVAGHYEMTISYYGNTLTDEELLNVAAGVSFPGK